MDVVITAERPARDFGKSSLDVGIELGKFERQVVVRRPTEDGDRHMLAFETLHDERVIGRCLQRARHEPDLPAGEGTLRQHRDLRQPGRHEQPLVAGMHRGT